jgi:hypothetical protein
VVFFNTYQSSDKVFTARIRTRSDSITFRSSLYRRSKLFAGAARRPTSTGQPSQF